MRPIRIALFIFCLGVALHAAADDARFFSSLQDVPIAPGLTELTDQNVTFDKPEGRIVESVALVQSVKESDVRAFYDDALPQLGWRKLGPLYFGRENETLRLDFEASQGQKFMRLSVAPKAVSTH